MLSIDRRCRHHVTPNPPLSLHRSPSEIPPTPAETHTPRPQPQPHPAKPSPKLLPFLLQALIMTLIVSLFFVFVGVAVIIFPHLCLVGGALHRHHSRRSRSRHHNHSDLYESRPGLSPAQLRTLPRTKFRAESESRNNSNEPCAICLDNCSEGSWCCQLPDCSHLFHASCVDRWLAKSPVCPICRTTVSLSRKDKETAEMGNCGTQSWNIFG